MNVQKRRVIYLICIIFAGMLTTVGFSYKFQILEHGDFLEKASKIQNRIIPQSAERGEIRDRNGKSIAINRFTYEIQCEVPAVTDLRATFEEVSKYVDIDVDAKLEEQASKPGKFFRIIDGVPYEQAMLIRENYIRGISVDQVSEREYPNGALASQLVGFASSAGGRSGLEYTLNDLLTGVDGSLLVTTDTNGRKLPYGWDQLTPSQDGTDVFLTIDNELQYTLEKALEEVYMKYEAIRATGLIMDVQSGELYAVANYPDYNLTDPYTYNTNLTTNSATAYMSGEDAEILQGFWNLPAATSNYEPGSIMKIITAAIALEENVVDVNEEFHCPGYRVVDGVRIKCWKHDYQDQHGDLTFEFGFADSCNPVFIDVADRLTAEDMYKYYEKLGLFSSTALPIAGEEKGIQLPTEGLPRVQKAYFSFGHGNSYTMLQVAQAVATTVNGGYLMEPHVIKRTVDYEGVETTIEPKAIRSAISSETSQQIRDLMHQVMLVGSGKAYSIDGVNLGGKSGSTERFDPETGYDGNGIIASFVEVAPIENPKYMVFVVVDNPQGKKANDISGSKVTGPIATEMMRKTLEHFGVVEYAHTGNKEHISTPLFVGLSYKDAMDKLEALGLPYVIVQGEGDIESQVVKSQFPEAGTDMEIGFKIRLTFGE